MSFEHSLIIFVVVVLSGFAYASFKGAPWVPTRKKDLQYILDNIEIPNNATVYDLGSGDGRAVFYFARNPKVIKAVGFELAWPLFLYAKIKNLFSPKAVASKVNFKFANLLSANFSEVDIIFCFLMPETIEQNFTNIFSQLKTGAQFISAVFPVNDVVPTKVLKQSNNDCSYYVYKK